MKFRNRESERFASGERVRKFESVNPNQFFKRLELLESAERLDDLRLKRSNRFEALKGDRRGQYSIRINDQWRICFEWSNEENAAFNIEIVDYH